MKALSLDSARTTDKVAFLGLTLQPKSMLEMNDLVEQGIRERQKWIIANHNLHSVYLFHKHAKLREFYANAHCTYVDGMPLVALGRLYGYRLQREQRVTNADWMGPLMGLAAEKGWRVFNLGSPKDVAEKGAAELRKLYPTLQIEVNDGYFDARSSSAENEALVRRINAYRPDLLMVGMGMPRQEFWTQENYAQLDAHVILSSNGAALDYVAGAVPTPPRWAGRIGMEWLFRLAYEPRRLFTRYLIEPWYVFLLLIMDYPRSRHGVKLRARAQVRAQVGG
jgi:N-acetylglucosaminyldiphosphoundecaprenol N-acetyl-beta-D-mannosaminyltransferase